MHKRYCFYTLGWGTSKSGVSLRILGVAPTEGGKAVALKVAETGACHLNPLHATVRFFEFSLNFTSGKSQKAGKFQKTQKAPQRHLRKITNVRIGIVICVERLVHINVPIFLTKENFLRRARIRIRSTVVN